MSRVIAYGQSFQAITEEITSQIRTQMEGRSYKAANELRNSALQVLKGQRSGRVYKLPGTHGKRQSKATKQLMPEYGKKLRGGQLYRASAPGEPPAVRFGHYRLSWQPEAHVVYGSYISRITSDARTDDGRHLLGEILEEGTARMAPRPHHDRILEHAEPKIFRIYDAAYFSD